MATKKPAQPKPSKKAQRLDGWYNVVSGVGTSIDKRMAARVQWNYHAQEDWEQLYAGDELASRIVNLAPEEALRRWVEWVGVSKEQARDINQRLQKLEARLALEKAWKWARAYGGSILYMVTDTDRPGEPLEEGERVIGLRDLSRYDLRILTTDIEADFGSPNYGRPSTYYLNVQMGSRYKGYPIHHSRVIRFDGYFVPRRTYIRNNYWHDSVLNRLTNVIRNYQTANDGAASILQDFNVGVYKMKNLANLVAAGKEDVVRSRLEILNYSKSIIKAMVLDADEEEFQDLSRNVSGLAELLLQQANRLVAATDIPHTKLLGESPTGSNATGNATTSSWYDHVQSQQENYLRPKIKRLVEVLFPELPDLDFKFPKLWQLDELQEAELRNKQAQTDQVYLGLGVLDPSEIAESRFGGDSYSTETKLDPKTRALGELAEEALLQSEPGDPEQEQSLEIKNQDETSQPRFGVGMEESRKALEGHAPGTTTPAPYDPHGKYGFKNERIPSKTEKATPVVSQTMSQPMRDPKTDPVMKPPGKPNKARVLADPEEAPSDRGD
jgi:phage-related protein (TIGR01555 family)